MKNLFYLLRNDKKITSHFFYSLFLSISIFITSACSSNQQNYNNDENKTISEITKKAASMPNLHSIIISQNGSILMEKYFEGFKANGIHDSRSSFKSITSLLAGIAIDKGYITDVNDPILEYFPEYKLIENWNEKKSQISLMHLLTMSSGFDCEEFYDNGPYCEDDMVDSEDWIKYSLDLPIRSAPGEEWAYTSCEPMLVGGVISNSSNKSMMEFTKEYLFDPLSITKYKWTISPKERGYTAGSFFILPKDMLKIGQLVLNNGKWKGKQIVSQKWIKESTQPQIELKDFSFVKYSKCKEAKYLNTRYGYYWYTERIKTEKIDTDVLFASGNGGQYIMILKEYKAVVIFTGGNYNNWKSKLPFKLLIEDVLPLLTTNNQIK